MAKHGKKFITASESNVATERYTIEEAINRLKNVAFAKFNESVDVSLRLGVDPRHADQVVRGTVVLPHGIGKDLRVAVVAQGDKAAEAKAAGADVVGDQDLIDKIAGGWFEFDTMITTPDMMGKVGKLGRTLGPRGLMPNPKSGTVTADIAKAVSEAKAGKIEFRVDKTGNVSAPIGKVNFDAHKLVENFQALMETINRLKPSSAKGIYLRTVAVSSTMGPGFKIDTNLFRH